jgi:hypothetical protein
MIYAIASGAASFTEEREGRTAVLLRTIPLTPADAFAGKWSYGLASTGLLLLALLVAGGTCTAIAWNTLPSHSASWSAPPPNFFFSRSQHGIPPMPTREIATSVWIGLVIPIVAFGISAFFSLLFSDGVMAALSGLFSTLFALLAAWATNVGGPSSSFALLISAIALLTVVADYRLTRLWLRGDSVVQARRWGGGGQHWGKTSFLLTKRRFDLTQALRVGEPGVPLRRAAQRLVWKECAQAWRYTKTLLYLAVLMTVLATLWPWSPAVAGSWLLALATPLVIGVGAYHADQQDGAYRLLGHHGVSADGAWIIKQIVWILNAVAAFALILLIREFAWLVWRHNGIGLSPGIAETVHSYFRRQPRLGQLSRDSLVFESAEIVLLYLALGYSIGQRVSFAYAKGAMAFALTAGLTLAACLAWSIIWDHGIPVGWTIGLVPPVLLADTWAHTERWQTQRMSSRRWYDIPFWTVLPFAGIVVALFLYWPLLAP